MAGPNYWQNNDLLPVANKWLTRRGEPFNKNRSNQHELYPGQYLNSPAGTFQLVFQGDLNLVLYGIDDSNFQWFDEYSCNGEKFSIPANQ